MNTPLAHVRPVLGAVVVVVVGRMVVDVDVVGVEVVEVDGPMVVVDFEVVLGRKVVYVVVLVVDDVTLGLRVLRHDEPASAFDANSVLKAKPVMANATTAVRRRRDERFVGVLLCTASPKLGIEWSGRLVSQRTGDHRHIQWHRAKSGRSTHAFRHTCLEP